MRLFVKAITATFLSRTMKNTTHTKARRTTRKWLLKLCVFATSSETFLLTATPLSGF